MRQLPLLGFPRFIANKFFQTIFFALHILLGINLRYPSQKENSNCYAFHSTTINVLRCLILPHITLLFTVALLLLLLTGYVFVNILKRTYQATSNPVLQVWVFGNDFNSNRISITLFQVVDSSSQQICADITNKFVSQIGG